MQDVFTTGKTFRAYALPVTLLRNGKLEVAYVDFVYEAMREADDSIIGVMAVAVEVTEQVIATQKIEESEKVFRELADSLPELVWTTDKDGKRTFMSRRWKEFTGVDPWQDNALVSLLHPDDVLPTREKWERCLQTGDPYNHQLRMKNSVGEYHWFYANGEAIRNAAGEIEKWVGAYTNLNEQKIAEEKLKLTSERFRLLADSMPQFVWTADAEGNLDYFNKAVYDYTDITAGEIENGGWLQIVHPDERDENIRLWLNAIKSGNDFVFEHRFRRNDGFYRWQLSRAIPQRDEYGNIQLWVGTSTDIHEIKALDEEKDFFIAMVSHELKTPITSMKGYVQLLQHKYKTSKDDFLRNSLSMVNKQIIKTTRLISELLDVSKIKSGSLSLNLEQVKVNQLVKEVINEIEHVHSGYNFHFTAQADALVFADRERIAQVLTNLISNAIKYSPGLDKISITTEIVDASVKVSIRDYGIGISKTDQQKIFQRFYRVEGKNENRFSGFGIGLFIASEIIKKHHGNIGVDSEPDQGSVFFFELPILP